MARQEADREDLLREATGLVDRVELRCKGLDDSFVGGFRAQGACSLFFGSAEVYQFNSTSALRRGFRNGFLLKAECRKLILLQRQMTPHETRFVRRELGQRQQDEWMEHLRSRLDWLSNVLARSEFERTGEVRGTGADVVDRLRRWLDQLPTCIAIASSPRVDD